MSLDEWMTVAARDAERRGIPRLVPLLDGLRASLDRLRTADWNDDLGPAVRRPDQAAGSRT
jgi:hypothetical protein